MIIQSGVKGSRCVITCDKVIGGLSLVEIQTTASRAAIEVAGKA